MAATTMRPMMISCAHIPPLALQAPIRHISDIILLLCGFIFSGIHRYGKTLKRYSLRKSGSAKQPPQPRRERFRFKFAGKLGLNAAIAANEKAHRQS